VRYCFAKILESFGQDIMGLLAEVIGVRPNCCILKHFFGHVQYFERCWVVFEFFPDCVVPLSDRRQYFVTIMKAVPIVEIRDSLKFCSPFVAIGG